jgi:glycosyltransferase involved in cell wall biosynthesis
VVDEEYNNKLQELITNYQLEEKIHFDGRVQIETLITSIINCDAYIHPSRYEPFGISIMESAFLGLPIIMDVSEKIGAGELLQDGISCIRLNYDKPLEAEKKLKSFITNLGKWNSIGKNGQKIAQGLKVEKEVSQLIEYVNEKL